jgi:hypothetical protein
MSNKYYKLSDAVLESILTGSAIYITPNNERVIFINGKKLEVEIVSNDKPTYTLKL